MRRALLLAALLLGAGVTAAPPPGYTMTITVRLADPVDRRVFGVGVVPEQFYFSFQTTYKIRGQTVPPAVFWRTRLKGRVLQVKAARRSGFWFAQNVNLVKE